MIWLREICLLLYVNDYCACGWKILLSWFGYVFAYFISCDTDWLSCIELMTCAYAWAVEIIFQPKWFFSVGLGLKSVGETGFESSASCCRSTQGFPCEPFLQKGVWRSVFGAKPPLPTGVSLLLVRPSPPFIATQLSQCWVVDEGVGLFG